MPSKTIANQPPLAPRPSAAPISVRTEFFSVRGDNGRVKISDRGTPKELPLADPGTAFRFTHTGTGESVEGKVGPLGRMAEVLTLPGKAGDSIQVEALSPETGASRAVAKLTVPGLPGKGRIGDPSPAGQGDELILQQFSGPLTVPQMTVDDVRQGRDGDCFLIAALASIWHASPETLTRMVRDNQDGTYTVTFHPLGLAGEKPRSVEVTVDADLYCLPNGHPAYASSRVGPDGQMPLLVPIIEKAYADLHQGYGQIDGGSSDLTFEELVGRRAVTHGIHFFTSQDDTWRWLQDHLGQKLPVCAGTGTFHLVPGVLPGHAYSVLGVSEHDGQRWVTLHNPWGRYEPLTDGVDDGTFELSLSDFHKCFHGMTSVTPETGDGQAHR